ncbi:thermonuclease family protein [Mycoplana rhizolycopersici]|uniref:Thermonuclease family protein n=1 Tax=Mycoplana rhizolycopersici TaxID=2746702 RepID=A0ABX2QCF1_9HYPH|nr:thermonuclease family protein [Rhizobium rhizolycopersici]NVP54868.1 thermonuclease family protein [Rhizobium rhizolycopersici]
MISFATASPHRATLGGIACVALTALIVVLGAGQIRDREASGGGSFDLEVPDASMFPTEGAQDDIPMSTPATDDNASDAGSDAMPSVQPAPQTDGGGDQKAGTQNAAEPATSAPAPAFNAAEIPVVTDPVALSRPIVLAAGRFSIGGKVLELDGIVPVAVTRQCTDSTGEGWPCGRMARTAFANLIRGRTIDCDLPSAQWAGTATARCLLAGKDLSQWLVENGWAEVEPGSGLQPAADTARAAGLGLYSPDPRRTRARSQDATGQTPADPSEEQQP